MNWCRLWHDLPNDPKFRTIARISEQPTANVIAVFVHLMVSASANATERGRTQLNAEDLASALDLQTEQVSKILTAMQGRLMDGEILTGWGKRQPHREDGSAERSRLWRESQKTKPETVKSNATERNRTKANDSDTSRGRPRDLLSSYSSSVDKPTGTENSSIEEKSGEDWFEEIYKRHPKKKDRGLAENYLSQITVDRKEFDRVHILYCEEWAKDKPGFAPTLAQWILDQGWKYPPGNSGGSGRSNYPLVPRYEKRPGDEPV